jgi:hypothetical protein
MLKPQDAKKEIQASAKVLKEQDKVKTQESVYIPRFD